MIRRYPDSVYLKCRHLFIVEEWNLKQISSFFDGNPSWQTVQNWAKEEDEHGNTWHDERKQYQQEIVTSITPEKIEALYQKRIYETLNDPDFNNKTSDALAKLQAQFLKIVNPARNIPVMYSFLEQFIDYLSKYHKNLLERELLDAIKDFKNIKRNELLSKLDT